MELKIKINSSNIDEMKKIAETLLDFEKEHRSDCTLSVEIEV